MRLDFARVRGIGQLTTLPLWLIFAGSSPVSCSNNNDWVFLVVAASKFLTVNALCCLLRVWCSSNSSPCHGEVTGATPVSRSIKKTLTTNKLSSLWRCSSMVECRTDNSEMLVRVQSKMCLDFLMFEQKQALVSIAGCHPTSPHETVEWWVFRAREGISRKMPGCPAIGCGKSPKSVTLFHFTTLTASHAHRNRVSLVRLQPATPTRCWQ